MVVGLVNRRFSPYALAVFIIGLLCVANPAAAQSMNYSVYNDVWSTEGDLTMYGYSELDDLSGCGSGAGNPQTWLYSPSRVAHTYSSTASLSFDDEEGNWSVTGLHQIQCNCSPYGGGHTFTAGFTIAAGVRRTTTYYLCTSEWTGCYCDPSCSSGTATCNFSNPILFGIGGCAGYKKATWLVVDYSEKGYACTWAWATTASGPGACT
jgi:hypothetical protein